MTKLLTHIKKLYQVRENTAVPLRGDAMNEVPLLENAYLHIDNGIIKDYGLMDNLMPLATDEVYDCSDQIVMPGYVDSHTHTVFAAGREAEYEDKIRGLSYEEIAARGGGILNSAATLAAMSENNLYEAALSRVRTGLKTGTTTLEIKSGYGLSLDSELKMLRVIKRLKETLIDNKATIDIKATFLGAHAFPKDYKGNRSGYIDLIIKEMLPQVEKENLADFIDVFCEDNYFTVKEMLRIIEAGSAHGLLPKVHVNQFNSLGAVSAAVAAGAISVDHLEVMNTADIDALSDSHTIATVLPGCSFFLGLDYAPVKEMMANNVAVAIASDFNPGSAPSNNMNMMFSLACTKMKMTPQQAYNAMTINAAHALQLHNEIGSITRGKQANLLFIEKATSLATIPYYYGENKINKVMLKGEML